MNNSIIKDPSFTEAPQVATASALRIPDHDVPEMAIGFGRHLPAGLNRLHGRNPGDYRSSMIGGVTFRKVDPLHEPLKVADARLQSHLESLCESLRAKY
jgi:hypothetical protein